MKIDRLFGNAIMRLAAKVTRQNMADSSVHGRMMLMSIMLCGMGLFAETPIVTGNAYGYTWTFKLLDGLSAAITSCSPEPHGDLKIPSELRLNEEIWRDGAKIVSVPVSSVEEGAFANCTRLTSVEFPNSSTFFHIRANAFDGCSNLVNVTMHEGLASIGEQAFASCIEIKNVEVPKSLVSMGMGTFWGCYNITNMVLPFVGVSRGSGVSGSPFGLIFSKKNTTAGDAYDGGINITQVLGRASYTYYMPSQLRSVTITDDIELKHAFMNCSMIKEINLANTITNIGDKSFANCTGLSQIKIPSSAVAVRGFNGCTGLRSVHTDDLAAWSSADFDSGPLVYAHNLYYKGELVQNLVIPDGVVNIGTFAFKDCTSIHSVTLPNSLKSIGYGAFESCVNLSGEVKIPDSVTSVNNRAFAKCTRLNRVDCGNGVKNLGENYYYGGGEVFDGCVNLSTVVLPNSISVLAKESLANCGIEELFIPDSVIQLGGQSRGWVYPFRGCSRLRRVRLPQSACDIPLKTLFPDSPITSVEVSSQVKMLKSGIFTECSTLKDVTIPSSVTNISTTAFDGCSGLLTISVAAENPCFSSKNGLLLSKDERNVVHGVNGDVIIPNGVATIGYHAFHSCSGLTSVTIPSSVTNIEQSAFIGCDGLSAVYISDLAAWCRTKFYSESNPLVYAHNLYLNGTLLTKLDIPDSIDVIGDYTFYGCRCLTSVTIPDSVTSIGQYALSGCNGLENLFFLGDAPSYYNNTFSGVGTVYVRRDSTGWGVSIPGWWQRMKIRYIGEPYLEINSNGTLTDVDLNGATEVVIPDTVTSIKDTAFLSCSNLTAVTIGANVRSIETDAFVGCSEIRSVTIPQAVCSSRMSTVFPSAYQSITNVAISEGVTTLEYRLFYGCTNLVSVTMPSSVRRVEADAFLGCNKLAGVFISDLAAWCGIEFVMDSIYSSNNAANPLRYAHNLYLNGLLISDLVIPEGVKSVSDMTFYNCTNILSVTIPEGVTNIGERAFSYCSSLTRVTISDSVKNIGQYAFFGCDKLEGVYITDLAAWCDIEFAVDEMFGAAYSANPLAYAHKLYLNGTSAEEIVVPNGVTRVGEYAFYNCTNITSVTIPDSVFKIGKRAFYGCVGLEDMTIGDGVKDIGERTFYGCENLDRVTIGNGVTNIGYEAFERCSKMKAVHITDLAAWCRIRFDRAAANPLYGSEKLYLDGKLITNLSIPDGVTTIGSWAFEHCKDITSVTIPDGVTSVGNYAFCDCQKLTQVTVPSSVTRIGTFAFASDWWANIYFKGTPPDVFDYGGLDSTESVGSCNGIYLPDYNAEWKAVIDADGRWHGIAMQQDNSTPDPEPDPDPDPVPGTPKFTIEDGVLTDVDLNGATEVTVPTGVTSVGWGAFAQCENLVSVVIPNGVTNIDDWAFASCRKLASVTLPPSLRSIGNYAFQSTAIESIDLPNGLTSLGTYAFASSKLNSITIPSGITVIPYAAFGCCPLMHITIPASVISIEDWAFEWAFNDAPEVVTVVFEGNAPIEVNAEAFNHSPAVSTYTAYVHRDSTGWGVAIPGTWKGIKIRHIGSREVIFDANGGKPAKQTLEQFTSEAWNVDGLQPPSKNGVAFGGWWTEKTGGERVELAGVCTLSGDTTLYARWLKAYKATAKDGIVYTDESEDIGSSVSALNGTRLYLEAADKSDKNMEFAYWSCSPATVELCDGFDLRYPYLECIMPEANVTFTANYVSKPGYVCVCVYEVNDTDNEDGEPEGIEWSADGKFWLAANDDPFPVKSGRTTLKLRSTDPRWTVPASATYTVENGNTVLDVDIAATRVAVITTDVLLEQSEASGTVTMNPKNGQVLPGKPVTLTAKAGKDSVFAYWMVGCEKVGYTATFKYAPDADCTVTAVFRLKSTVADPALDVDAVVPSANATVGVAFEASVPLDYAAYPAKFSAKGLPAGLKIDAASGMISGVPTKVGDYAVTITAAGGANGKAKSSMTLPITIKPLPEWAQGTFTGRATAYVEGEDDEDVPADSGLATVTVSAAGKVSGKVSLCGTNWTFSATSYDAASTTGAADEDLDGAEEFVIVAEMKSGKIVKPLRLTVTRAEPPQDDGEVLQNASVWGWTTSGMESFELCRTMWKDKSTAAASKAVLAAWEGVYTLSLGSAEDYGSGYLSLTVGKDGNVKATGKLADGTGVSATSPLMYDADFGYFAYLYAAPSAYKGGCLALAVGFDAAGARDARPYQLAPVMFEPQWTSRNPQATGEYGEGFDRTLEFSGAYYDKLNKLSEYYEQMRLSLSGAPMLSYTYKSTHLDDDTGRKVTESWLEEAEAVDTLNQDGLTVAVDEKGKIVVTKATKPVQDRETKEWYYEGANDGALALSFTQATGIFKGSYTFWYDYMSAYDETTDKATMAHTSKKVNFEGILVQGDESMRGFYLWDATGAYEDPKTGKEKSYKYKMSFPVSLLSE